MELTLNINVGERFCEAIELLAAAISGKKVASTEIPTERLTEGLRETEEAVDKESKWMTPEERDEDGKFIIELDEKKEKEEAPLEKLKKELDLEVVEEVTVTADMLRDKMQTILGKNPNYALDVKGALKGLGAERISDLDEKKYLDFYNMLSDIEKEVAA